MPRSRRLAMGSSPAARWSRQRPECDFKSLVVLTDGQENRTRFISEVSSLINNRVFAIGLGTPEQIQPIALNALTNGTDGYLIMTGTLDADDPFRLAQVRTCRS